MDKENLLITLSLVFLIILAGVFAYKIFKNKTNKKNETQLWEYILAFAILISATIALIIVIINIIKLL